MTGRGTRGRKGGSRRAPGQELVGREISVSWPEDRVFYEAMVIGYEEDTHAHKVLYLRDETIEIVDLRARKWKMGPSDGSDGLIGKHVFLHASDDESGDDTEEKSMRYRVCVVRRDDDEDLSALGGVCSQDVAPLFYRIVYLDNDYLASVDLAKVQYSVVPTTAELESASKKSPAPSVVAAATAAATREAAPAAAESQAGDERAQKTESAKLGHDKSPESAAVPPPDSSSLPTLATQTARTKPEPGSSAPGPELSKPAPESSKPVSTMPAVKSSMPVAAVKASDASEAASKSRPAPSSAELASARPVPLPKPTSAAKSSAAPKPLVTSQPHIVPKHGLGFLPVTAPKPSAASRSPMASKPAVAPKPTIVSKSFVSPTSAAAPQLAASSKLVASSKSSVASTPALLPKPTAVPKPAVAPKSGLESSAALASKPATPSKPLPGPKAAIAPRSAPFPKPPPSSKVTIVSRSAPASKLPSASKAATVSEPTPASKPSPVSKPSPASKVAPASKDAAVFAPKSVAPSRPAPEGKASSTPSASAAARPQVRLSLVSTAAVALTPPRPSTASLLETAPVKNPLRPGEIYDCAAPVIPVVRPPGAPSASAKPVAPVAPAASVQAAGLSATKIISSPDAVMRDPGSSESEEIIACGKTKPPPADGPDTLTGAVAPLGTVQGSESLSDEETLGWVRPHQDSAEAVPSHSLVGTYIELKGVAGGDTRQAFVETYLPESKLHFVAFCDPGGGNMQIRLDKRNFRSLTEKEVELIKQQADDVNTDDQKLSEGRENVSGGDDDDGLASVQKKLSRKPPKSSNANAPESQPTSRKRRRSADVRSAPKRARRSAGRRQSGQVDPNLRDADLVGRCIKINWPDDGFYTALVIGLHKPSRRRALFKILYIEDRSIEVVDLARRMWELVDRAEEPWNENSLIGKRVYVFWEGEYEDKAVEARKLAEEKFGVNCKVPFEAYVVAYEQQFDYCLVYTESDDIETRTLPPQTPSADGEESFSEWGVLEKGVEEVDGLPLISWSGDD